MGYCPGCKLLISRTAERCPRCGFQFEPAPEARVILLILQIAAWLLTGYAVIATLAVAGIFIGGLLHLIGDMNDLYGDMLRIFVFQLVLVWALALFLQNGSRSYRRRIYYRYSLIR